MMVVLWILVFLLGFVNLWMLYRLHHVSLKVDEVADRLYKLDKDIRG